MKTDRNNCIVFVAALVLMAELCGLVQIATVCLISNNCLSNCEISRFRRGLFSPLLHGSVFNAIIPARNDGITDDRR